MIPLSTWKHIYRSLYNKSCVLILGPDIATFNDGKNEKKLLKAFSNHIGSQMIQNKISFDQAQKDDLSYTSLRWLKGGRKNSLMLRDEMKCFFDDSSGILPQMYKKNT
jgi:hypothetical protein